MTINLKGCEVRISACFSVAATGMPGDPATVQLRLYKPLSGLVVYTYGVGVVVLRDSTGAYRADFILDEIGMWKYRWEGTGSIVAATEGSFVVKEPNC